MKLWFRRKCKRTHYYAVVHREIISEDGVTKRKAVYFECEICGARKVDADWGMLVDTSWENQSRTRIRNQRELRNVFFHEMERRH